MERRSWLVLLTSCLVIAPIAFALGLRSGSRLQDASRAAAIVSESQTAPSGRIADAPEFANVTIENLGTVEFDHAFELLRTAPTEALATWTKRLEGLPVGPRRTAGIKAFFKTLAQIDTKTAVDLALSMDRHDPRSTAFGAVTSATPAVNLGEVARMYTALNEKTLSLGDFVHEWSRTDPARAAEWISKYPGQLEKNDIAALIGNWAALDPAAAREWLAGADAKHRDPDVYARFYAGWVEADPAAAMSELSARGADENFRKAIETVAEELFKDSPEATRTFVFTLAAGVPQKTAAGAIVGDVTAIYLGGGPDFEAADVAKWLLTLPEDLWSEDIGEVMNRWNADDKAGRQAWLEQLPLQTRDKVLAAYCLAYPSQFETENFQAALRISDPQLRQQTLRKAFEKFEPETRRELLEALQLSGDEARELEGVLARL